MPGRSEKAAAAAEPQTADTDDSDSEDEDFKPEEEETKGRGPPIAGAASGGLSGQSSKKRKRGFMEVSDEEDGDGGVLGEAAGEEEELVEREEEGDLASRDEEEEGQDEGEEEETYNPRKAARKAKIESIWSALKGSVGGVGITSVPQAKYGCAAKLSSGYVAGTTLAALCQPVEDPRPAPDPDKHWMRALGMESKLSKPIQIDKSAALAALEAAKTATSVAAVARAGKVVVTEKRKFAGKEVEVSKEVSKAEASKPKSSGLDQLLASMQGSKKISVLDKSRDDWRTFKGSNTEVEEELESHKKSGDKYLDKQEFLKQAELKQYERERDQRLAADVRTRGRL